MSWLENIQNQLTITCGDGKKFSPSWLNASFQREYNVSEYEYPNQDGTFVRRTRPLGRRYAIEIYFQGEDHLDTAASFMLHADDPRPWKMEHPFYGIINVQPTSLVFDNTAYNTTKITGLIVETILEDRPATKISPIDSIKIKKLQLDNSFENFAPKTVTGADIKAMNYRNRKNYNIVIPNFTVPKQVELYNNAFSVANAAVNNATASPLLAIRYTIALINKPAQFTIDTKQRFKLFLDQFNVMRENITGLTEPSSKQVYQATAGSVVSAMTLGSVTDNSYKKANDIFDNMDQLLAAYNQYMADMDSLQSANAGSPDSFVANAEPIFLLNDIVNIAISNLFEIALAAKQQRTIITDKDTNIILLTHRLYGLDADDANITELFEENGFGLNHLFLIKKGTTITYYK